MIQEIQQNWPGVTIFNVVGADSVVKLCRNGSKFLQAMVIVGRAGSNNKVVQETVANSEAAGAPVYYVDELPGHVTSSDALQALKQQDEEALTALLPASVADYLLEHIHEIFGEDHVPVMKAPKFVPRRGERNFNLLADGPVKPETRPTPRAEDQKTGKNQQGYTDMTTFDTNTPEASSVEHVPSQPRIWSHGMASHSEKSATVGNVGLPLGMPLPPLGGKSTLVVAVTGAPSAGKSALALELQHALWEHYGTQSSLMISQQAYDLGYHAGRGAWMWERKQWLSYWESPDSTDWHQMEAAIVEASKQHPIVIVEGHCLFSCERVHRLLNCLIWIDVAEEDCWNRRSQYPKGWEPAHYFYKCLWPGHVQHVALALGVQKSAPGCDGRSATIGPSRSLCLNGIDKPTALRQRALKAVLRWLASVPAGVGADVGPGLTAHPPDPMFMQCQ